MLLLLLLWMPRGAQALDNNTIELLTPLKVYGEACGYEACQVVKEDHINVHVVPHSHAELGYFGHFYTTYTGRQGENFNNRNINMKKILDSVLTELWVSNTRTFTISDSELPYFFYWWSRRDGTVRRMVYQLVRTGRLSFVGGGWGMVDEATTSYHAIIDQYTYTLRKLNATFLGCGRPLVSFQSDVMGHSKEFAALMALMGYDALFVSPISSDDEVQRMERNFLEFVWRGSDDLGPASDIFTHKLFDGFMPPPGFCFSGLCSSPLIITSDSFTKNVDDRVDAFITAIKYRQSPYYSTRNIMVVMGHRLAYHDAKRWFENTDKLIENLLEKSYRKELKINIFYSSPACYLDAVRKYNPPLESKQDDFFPFSFNKNYVVGMYTSRPSVKYMAREGHVYLQMAKQLNVLARLSGFDDYFENMQWITGILQDHNVISGAMRTSVKHFYTKTFDYMMTRSMRIFSKAFNVLSAKPNITADQGRFYRCSFNTSTCKNSNSGLPYFILVYNPLSWPVTIPVRLPTDPRLNKVYDHKGLVIPSFLIPNSAHLMNVPEKRSKTTHELVFLATEIPSLGYRSYFIDVETKKRQQRSIGKRIHKRRDKKKNIAQSQTDFNDDILNLDDDLYDALTNPAKNLIGDTTTQKDDLATITPAVDFDQTSKFTTTMLPGEDIEEIGTNTIHVYVTPTDGLMATSSAHGTISATTANIWTEENSTEQTITEQNRIEQNITEQKGTERAAEINVVTEEITYSVKEINDFINKNVMDKPDANIIMEEDPKNETSIIGEEEGEVGEKVEGEIEKEEKEEKEELEDTRRFNIAETSTSYQISNEWIAIFTEEKTKKINMMLLRNNINVSLDIQFYYYVSKGQGEGAVSPGAYVMKPCDKVPVPIEDYLHTRIYKTAVVEELHVEFSTWASYVVRIYKDSPVAEVDWIVGPIPHGGEGDYGKDVFIRYKTDLVNEGVFYTDANGRQTVKRIRNRRASYTEQDMDEIAGNFYPVTSRVYMEDPQRRVRVSVCVDRAQGGASPADGQLDLLLHRRIHTDDTDASIYLNDTCYDKGIVARGTHYLYITKSDDKSNRIFEKIFAKEVELRPQVFLSVPFQYFRLGWKRSFRNQYSALNRTLPVGVHLLTLEAWTSDSLLIRFENFLEKSDAMRSGIKRVFPKYLLKDIVIISVRETMLGGNIWLNEHRRVPWNVKDRFLKSFNEYYGNKLNETVYVDEETADEYEEVDVEAGFLLKPQQIRTFVAQVKYTH